MDSFRMTTDSWLFAISLAWCAIIAMAVLFCFLQSDAYFVNSLSASSEQQRFL